MTSFSYISFDVKHPVADNVTDDAGNANDKTDPFANGAENVADATNDNANSVADNANNSC